jgi:hypothetical protein
MTVWRMGVGAGVVDTGRQETPKTRSKNAIPIALKYFAGTDRLFIPLISPRPIVALVSGGDGRKPGRTGDASILCVR